MGFSIISKPHSLNNKVKDGRVMVSGKHSPNSIKIQLVFKGKKVFFARIKKNLWEKLKIAIDGTEYFSRTDWIKSEIRREFDIELKSADELSQFNALLDSHNYEDSNDWLREKIRHYLMSKT